MKREYLWEVYARAVSKSMQVKIPAIFNGLIVILAMFYHHQYFHYWNGTNIVSTVNDNSNIFSVYIWNECFKLDNSMKAKEIYGEIIIRKEKC